MNRNVKLLVAFIAVATSARVFADSGGASPRELFSNDYLQVNRVTLSPGEGLELHRGSARIVYSLSDYTIRWTEDGESAEKGWREGGVHAHEALEHAVENTGDTIADFLVLSRTDTPLPAVDDPDDAAEVPGAYARVVAQLDGARVLRVVLPPGAEQPLHAGAPRLVYSLNDYAAVFTTPEGERTEVELKTGDVHWHEAGPHAVANAGKETARFIIFAFE